MAESKISAILNSSLKSECNVYPEDMVSEIGFQLSVTPKLMNKFISS